MPNDQRNASSTRTESRIRTGLRAHGKMGSETARIRGERGGHVPNALRGVAQREDQVPGIAAGESLADPEVVRRTRLQAVKALLDEGQPGIAGRVLGQVSSR